MEEMVNVDIVTVTHFPSILFNSDVWLCKYLLPLVFLCQNGIEVISVQRKIEW